MDLANERRVLYSASFFLQLVSSYAHLDYFLGRIFAHVTVLLPRHLSRLLQEHSANIEDLAFLGSPELFQARRKNYQLLFVASFI